MPKEGGGSRGNFSFHSKDCGAKQGKSVISASAYLNGDVMKNDETGKFSYYTAKKEVVYRQLSLCENAPPQWAEVPEENIDAFRNPFVIKGQKTKKRRWNNLSLFGENKSYGMRF